MHSWYGSGIINTLNKLFLSGIGDVFCYSDLATPSKD